MIIKADFKSYCRPNEDYVRIQDSDYLKGDLCFILDDQGYAYLYNCSEGYYLSVPIRSIGNMKALYKMLTNKEL